MAGSVDEELEGEWTQRFQFGARSHFFQVRLTDTTSATIALIGSMCRSVQMLESPEGLEAIRCDVGQKYDVMRNRMEKRARIGEELCAKLLLFRLACSELELDATS